MKCRDVTLPEDPHCYQGSGALLLSELTVFWHKAKSHVGHPGAHRTLDRSVVPFESEFTNLKNGAWDLTGMGYEA